MLVGVFLGPHARRAPGVGTTRGRRASSLAVRIAGRAGAAGGALPGFVHRRAANFRLCSFSDLAGSHGGDGWRSAAIRTVLGPPVPFIPSSDS